VNDSRHSSDPVREAALHRLLASPVRLAILHELRDCECPAGEIALRVGLAQSPTSQHLARLRAGRLVLTRKVAQVVHYRIAADVCEALDDMQRTTERLLGTLPAQS
jgi:DNA-binding transcriptional ArsR family regulator